MNDISAVSGIPDETLRLLKVLAEPGGFARRHPDQKDTLAIFRVRQSLTLGAGQTKEATAAPLLRDGLAAWTLVGRHRHLVVSAAGIARLHHVTDRRPVPAEESPGSGRGDAFRDKDGDRAGAGKHGTVMVNTRESPLAWLHRRRNKSGQPLITPLQFVAGERLRADLELSQMLPRVTANWSAPVSSSAPGQTGSPSDTAIAARERVNRACIYAGPEFSGLLIDVCGFLKGLEQVEAERRWPARSAKLLLAMALDRLAEHYGLSEPRPGFVRKAGPAKPRVVNHAWQASDARPSLLPEQTGKTGGS